MKQEHHSLIQLVVLGGALCAALDGQAATILDFGMTAPTTGSIAYSGGSAPLVGSNINLDNIVGLGTALHNNVASSCVSCVVQFSSGAFSSYNATTQTWDFSGGGTITVVGGVNFSDNSSMADIATGTTLLTGTFNGASVIKLATGMFDFRIAAGSFTDMKNPDLLAYYGLPTNVGYEGGFNLSFSATPLANNGFTSTALYSGDIVNSPVPLPAAFWLLGSGLVALGSSLRRKASV